MSTQLVKTQSGSLYVIDRAAMTWARIDKGEKSGPLRDEQGTFQKVHIKVGEQMLIFADYKDDSSSIHPLIQQIINQGAKPVRLVLTSDVVSVEEQVVA